MRGERYGFRILAESLTEVIETLSNAEEVKHQVNALTEKKMGANHWNRIVFFLKTMTVHLVTFSDESMSRARGLCASSAMVHGVDNIWLWSREDIEDSKYADEERGDTLALMRKSLRGGGGWWCWKPYIIHDTFCQLPKGSLVVYSDAGVEFINNVSHIIERMDQDIFLFGNNWEHAHWCKADVPSEILGKQRVSADGVQNWLWQDHPKHDVGCACRVETIIFGKQVQASVIFFRVSDYTRQFVAEWLKWCLFEGGRLIDDSPSRLPNHPEFREHRHDQSILTTLSYREGLRLHWWPAVYNRFVPGGPVFTYEKGGYQDDYPPLFHHHRLRNDQWPQHMLTEPTEANRDIALHGTK